jgi:hypothetical protein
MKTNQPIVATTYVVERVIARCQFCGEIRDLRRVWLRMTREDGGVYEVPVHLCADCLEVV